MPSQYAGKIFQFSRKRLGFVHLETEDKDGRILKGESKAHTKCPFIWDKKRSMEDMDKYQEFPVNETGAFILGFLLQKVPSELIAQLYQSEFGGTQEEAEQKVDDFITDLIGRKLVKDVTTEIRPKALTAPTPGILSVTKFLGFDIETKVGTNQSNHYKILYRI